MDLGICGAIFGVLWLASALLACGLPQAKRPNRSFITRGQRVGTKQLLQWRRQSDARQSGGEPPHSKAPLPSVATRMSNLQSWPFRPSKEL